MQPVWQTLKEKKPHFLTSIPCLSVLQLAVSLTCPPQFWHDDLCLEVFYNCALLYLLVPCDHCPQWLYLDLQKVQRDIASCKSILGLVEIGHRSSGISPNICLLCIFFTEVLNNICTSVFQGETVLFNASKVIEWGNLFCESSFTSDSFPDSSLF